MKSTPVLVGQPVATVRVALVAPAVFGLARDAATKRVPLLALRNLSVAEAEIVVSSYLFVPVGMYSMIKSVHS